MIVCFDFTVRYWFGLRNWFGLVLGANVKVHPRARLNQRLRRHWTAFARRMARLVSPFGDWGFGEKRRP